MRDRIHWVAVGLLAASGAAGAVSLVQLTPGLKRPVPNTLLKEWEAAQSRLRPESSDDILRETALDARLPPSARNASIRALEKRRAPGVLEVVLQILYENPSYTGRMSLVEILGRSKHPVALLALERIAVEDSDVGVRYTAIQGLVESLRSYSVLVRAIKDDPSPIVRRAAIRALALRSGDGRKELFESICKLETDDVNKELAHSFLRAAGN